MEPKAVLFDFDGTLVDTEGPDCALLSRLFAEEGLSVAPEDVARAFAGVTRSEIRSEVLRRYGVRLSDSWLDRYRLGRAELERTIRVSDGALSFLGRLRDAGILLALVTNSRERRIARVLAGTGLGAWFGSNVFHLGEGVRMKPAPDMYLSALSALHVSPGEALAIEDSAPGVEAAAAAGITCRGYTGNCPLRGELASRLLASGAEETFASFSEISDWFFAVPGIGSDGPKAQGRNR